jgi:hypothetical protein
VEKHFQEQLERIDRLLKIVHSDDEHSPLGGALTFYDIVIFACQSMWHLKDWILNDPEFHPKDTKQLETDIHAEKCLLICADLANGSKHLVLKRPKVGASLWERQGIHDYPSQGIFQTFYYIVCSDHGDQYHGMEIRALLAAARQSWDTIIDRHHLSNVTLPDDLQRDLDLYIADNWK